METKIKPSAVWQAMTDLEVLFRRFLKQQGWSPTPSGDWVHRKWGHSNMADAIIRERERDRPHQAVKTPCEFSRGCTCEQDRPHQAVKTP